MYDEARKWSGLNMARYQVLTELAAECGSVTDEAVCLLNGWGGKEQDAAGAFAILSAEAGRGVAAAQCDLGYCYNDGQGVEQDSAKAFEWYSKAAEQGYAGAQHNIGVCYYNGAGVEQDSAKAFEWYSKAAEQGHAVAQARLQG